MDFTASLRAALGPTVYDRHGALLVHGDCLAAMRRMPKESVDLVVTSPPYNIGKAYETVTSLDDYLRWTAEWTTEVARVLKPSGAFWLNVGYVPVPGHGKAVPLPYLLWDRVPMFLVQEVVWNYGAGVAGRHFFSPRNEKFLFYVKDAEAYTFNLDEVRDPDVKYPNQKKNGKLKCNPLGKNPTDVWAIPKVTSGAGRASKERTPHPAQFPEALIERVILVSSNEGEIVLDPFAGSGTTAAVASKNGRLSIGFEKERGYLDIAGQRVDDAHRQLSLMPSESADLTADG
jgi:adenine-specific DNA-methyltransferase